MSVRIRRFTKIGNGKYISESYKPSEYFFITITKWGLKFFFLELPFYIIKLTFFLIRIPINIFLKDKENSQTFLNTLNNPNLAVNQLDSLSIFSKRN